MFKLLMGVTGLQFRDLARQIDEKYGNTGGYEPKPEAKPDKPRIQLSPIAGTEVEIYLRSRGITVFPELDIGTAYNIYHKETGGNYMAMHAIARDAYMNECMIHQTYLTNGVKLKNTSKKMFSLSHSENICVKMFYMDKCLGVGEGIESSLSACQIYGVPVWATLSSALMKKFRAPPGVEHLIIYADSEPHGAGLAAAFECGNKNILANNDVSKVTIRWPELGDFNDVLNNIDIKVLKYELSRG
jgi:putative DNA primase/helicase